jgi:hypothetical protein
MRAIMVEFAGADDEAIVVGRAVFRDDLPVGRGVGRLAPRTGSPSVPDPEAGEPA